MATGLYVKGKENLGKKNIDLIGDDLYVLLVDTSIYTVNLDTDEYFADIPEAATIKELELFSKNFVDSVFDADDVIFQSLTSDKEVGGLVIYQDTGILSTSRLIFYTDVSSVTPDGTDLTVAWDNGPSRIFRL